jgi:hypothetical protein
MFVFSVGDWHAYATRFAMKGGFWGSNATNAALFAVIDLLVGCIVEKLANVAEITRE